MTDEKLESGCRDRDRIYQWLVIQKWRAIENEHKQVLIEDQRKVDAGLFRPLPLNRRKHQFEPVSRHNLECNMKLSDLKESEIMFEMVNLIPRSTGVGYVMHFGEIGGQHGPRIKVSNTPGKFNVGNNFSLSVSKTPQIMTPPTSVGISQGELNKIIQWIQINYDDLMLLWKIYETGDFIQDPERGVIDDITILSRLKKV